MYQAMSKTSFVKWGAALVMLSLAIWLNHSLGEYLSLSSIKQHMVEARAYCQARPVASLLLFFLGSMLWVGLAVPGAAVFPIIGGMLFGTWVGGIIATLSMGIGCAMAFLLARFIIGDWLQKKFADRLQKLNRGIEKDGLLYLVILRYMPVVPFFLTNLLTGLTTIPARTFCWATTLTILPGNLIAAYIGSTVSQWEKITDILKPEFIIAAMLFSVFPLAVKRVIVAVRARRDSSDTRKNSV